MGSTGYGDIVEHRKARIALICKLSHLQLLAAQIINYKIEDGSYTAFKN